jgi:hypothetical protein
MAGRLGLIGKDFSDFVVASVERGGIIAAFYSRCVLGGVL